MDGERGKSWRDLNQRLLRWHQQARRPLAIRDASTPWEVLVGEVMSQQTTIDRIGPRWRAWIERWPTPADLATASTHDVLAAWSGLGYNRRALALRAAARALVEDHAGQVPAAVEDLERLPGVGSYTARAVAALAFGAPVAPVDVNVRRVVSRLHGEPMTPAALQSAADDMVDPNDPGRWVSAVMDLAATVCTRVAPRCWACPVFAGCATQGREATGEPAREAARRASAATARVPFSETRRWLRGRLLALAVGAPAGSWVPLPDGVGSHDATAVQEAAEALAREGFFAFQDGRIRVMDDHRSAGGR